MGSGSSKTTNKMLAQQGQNFGNIANTAGDRSQQIYDAGRGDIDFARENFKSMYSGLGEGGGGGGISYNPVAFDSSSLPFYQKMMNEGGYSEADKANILSYATGPITGMFEGLKRNLQTMSAGRGLGYGSGLSRLGRDQAYAGSEMAKGVAGDLAEKVLASRFQGAAGTTGVESEKRAFEAAERDRQQAAARANAARGNDVYNQQRQLLYDILGLESDKDLQYMDRQLGAESGRMGTITGRVDETPLWQKSAAQMLPAAAGAAVSAFMPTSLIGKAAGQISQGTKLPQNWRQGRDFEYA